MIQEMTGKTPSFDDATFREVLGHYPTGVACVTAVTDEGHQGMVVGSFSSVSLKPPLVAFLADHGSRTYAKLKLAKHFTVNVLGAHQERLCRQFSSKTIEDKWDGVDWETGKNGVRKLTGAVAHIECTHAVTYEAGDHDIVICAVNALATEKPDLPLLFFQGAFGRFIPQSFVVPSQIDAAGPLRLCDAARPELEALAQELDADCTAQALVRGELVFLARFNGGGTGPVPQAGSRVPHLPPMGTLLAAWDEDARAAWLAAAPVADRPKLETVLERVRARGFSVALEAPEYGPLERVRERFTAGRATPAEERFLRGMAGDLAGYYEPEVIPETEAGAVRVVGVPVFSAPGTVGLLLQLWNPPLGPDLTVHDIAARLKTIADRIGAAGGRYRQSIDDQLINL